MTRHARLYGLLAASSVFLLLVGVCITLETSLLESPLPEKVFSLPDIIFPENEEQLQILRQQAIGQEDKDRADYALICFYCRRSQYDKALPLLQALVNTDRKGPCHAFYGQ